ncbi:phosphotransferase [Actinokineospora spheciospongiae]|uniref:phosphotransferase n=1 Tax=Actinokineospora spheciospongiae TaxID=909613 RepID=UPI001C63E8C1|nr:phosphotransferase [Actinokineospora spheciospongiae]
MSVRRDLDGHFPAAYEGARLLRAGGKEYVLAPLAGRDGRVVHTVGGLPVVVFPYLDHVAASAGHDPTPGELDELVRRLAEVHETALDVDLPEEDFRAPFEEDLATALRTAVESGAAVGPLSHDLRLLIAEHRDSLDRRRAEFAEVAAACAHRWAQGSPRALTHGDPSAANVVLEPELLILDWGGLMVSPPERDHAALTRAFGLPPRGSSDMLRFYELRWILAEVAEYTSHLVKPHTGDSDDRAMWVRLLRYLHAG